MATRNQVHLGLRPRFRDECLRARLPSAGWRPGDRAQGDRLVLRADAAITLAISCMRISSRLWPTRF